MRTAKKIELRPIDYPLDGFLIPEQGKLFALYIDGERVIDQVYDGRFDPREFQTCVCDYCGTVGCNPCNMLCVRRHEDRLLIIPQFDVMDGEEDFEEYDFAKDTGYRYCPPHSWYEHGILVLEAEQVEELYRLLPRLKPESIKPITVDELAMVDKWERMVIERPVGFMRED